MGLDQRGKITMHRYVNYLELISVNDPNPLEEKCKY